MNDRIEFWEQHLNDKLLGYRAGEIIKILEGKA
jgi:hypothetical protein